MLVHFSKTSSEWSKATTTKEWRKLSIRKPNGFTKADNLSHDINRVEKIAKAKGISMAQLALAWIMSQDGMVSFFILSFWLTIIFRRIGAYCRNDLSWTFIWSTRCVLSIPFSMISSLDGGPLSTGAVNVQLTEEEKKELETPYLAQAAFGHA